MNPMVETAFAAAAGAAVVAIATRAAAKTAVRRQIMAGIAQMDQQFDRDRDHAIEAMPAQAREAIDAEVGRAIAEYHITPAQIQALVAAVRRVRGSLPPDFQRRLLAA